jgi:hypothetical protein
MEPSLQKIQLPDFVLVDLYKESIVALNNQQQQKEKTKTIASSPKGKWFLGDNKKQISILVYDIDAVFLNDDSYTFLSSILAACKLNVGDVAIVNIAKTNISFQIIQQELKPLNILIFDLNKVNIELPFSIVEYQIHQHDNCAYLSAASLQMMQGNTQVAKIEKGKLWSSLQKFFQLK